MVQTSLNCFGPFFWQSNLVFWVFKISRARPVLSRAEHRCTHRYIAGNSNKHVATSGQSSARISLPHILRSLLPISASAIKQAWASTLKDKWETAWAASPRKLRIEQFDKNFLYDSFRKRAYTLSRYHSSLIMQIRCSHIPLNGYLHKIGKKDTEICQQCNEEEDRAPALETVKHFIFKCPVHAKLWTELIEK